MAFSIFTGKQAAAGDAGSKSAAAGAPRSAPGAVRAGPASSMNIEVGAADSSVAEEAAILYANGQSREARACLRRAVEGGSGEELVWLMLLDLHQLSEERAAFDALALEYVVRFERSAPTWREAEAKAGAAQPLSAAPRAGGVVALSGKLSAASASDLDKLRALDAGDRNARIDFARLAGADATGCRMLLEALQGLRARGVVAALSGEATLLAGLARATRPGARQTDAALWLLRMEILQWLGRAEEFEEVALDYAVTFEVSPPSFEARAVPAAAAEAAPQEALVAPREIVGEVEGFVRELEAWAAARDEVRVDLAATRRIGFVAAGSLLNAATRLHGQGKRVQLEQANALVAVLLELMGLPAVAGLRLRR